MSVAASKAKAALTVPEDGWASPVVLAAPTIVVALAGVVLAATGHMWAATGVALVVAVAGGLALHVDLPWGGRLTLGHAVLIAMVARVVPPWASLVIAAAGVALALPSWLEHRDEGSVVARIAGALSAFVATMAALTSRLILDTL